MGTTANTEVEIQERAVSVLIPKEKVQEHREAFEAARERYHDLMPIAKSLLDHTLASVNLEWVESRNARNKKLVNLVVDRRAINWYMTLTGLDLLVDMHRVLQQVDIGTQDLQLL
jgi:hypothetical protein